jgi:hypothetical protein
MHAGGGRPRGAPAQVTARCCAGAPPPRPAARPPGRMPRCARCPASASTGIASATAPARRCQLRWRPGAPAAPHHCTAGQRSRRGCHHWPHLQVCGHAEHVALQADQGRRGHARRGAARALQHGAGGAGHVEPRPQAVVQLTEPGLRGSPDSPQPGRPLGQASCLAAPRRWTVQPTSATSQANNLVSQRLAAGVTTASLQARTQARSPKTLQCSGRLGRPGPPVVLNCLAAACSVSCPCTRLVVRRAACWRAHAALRTRLEL